MFEGSSSDNLAKVIMEALTIRGGKAHVLWG
jgi:hypothetical protein